MKKLLALLPIIGLVLGTVAIATEIRKPTLIDQKPTISVPACSLASFDPVTHPGDLPILCAE